MASFSPTPEMIDAVAEWHQRQSDLQAHRPLVPHLRDRFGISNVEAVAVIRASAHLTGGANASGS
jgi:hypothetical protein